MACLSEVTKNEPSGNLPPFAVSALFPRFFALIALSFLSPARFAVEAASGSTLPVRLRVWRVALVDAAAASLAGAAESLAISDTTNP